MPAILEFVSGDTVVGYYSVHSLMTARLDRAMRLPDGAGEKHLGLAKSLLVGPHPFDDHADVRVRRGWEGENKHAWEEPGQGRES